MKQHAENKTKLDYPLQLESSAYQGVNGCDLL